MLMPNDLLFSPYQLGPISLANRVVMAPMTRNRAIGNIPGDLVATEYAQRAEAGLIVSEGTSPSPNGLGYARIPGLFNEEQVAAWKNVTSKVHAAAGRIFVQLMHTGRATHPDNLPRGARALAPSAVALGESVWVDPDGPKPAPAPEAMTAAEVESTIEEYAKSSELAIAAGFDGVELHGANGYLIEQFLNTASNHREDEWGGSIPNRVRFATEVARRAAARIGADRVGIRLSPFGAFNGMKRDPATEDEVYVSLAKALSDVGLLYLHLVDHSAMGAPEVGLAIKKKIREAFRGKLILSGGYDRATAEADLSSGLGDLVAFGRPFIANPTLVSRLKAGQPLDNASFDTFYTSDEKGYTDYASS
jgi:N-ethylmaleimide reductase